MQINVMFLFLIQMQKRNPKKKENSSLSVDGLMRMEFGALTNI